MLLKVKKINVFIFSFIKWIGVAKNNKIKVFSFEEKVELCTQVRVNKFYYSEDFLLNMNLKFVRK